MRFEHDTIVLEEYLHCPCHDIRTVLISVKTMTAFIHMVRSGWVAQLVVHNLISRKIDQDESNREYCGCLILFMDLRTVL